MKSITAYSTWFVGLFLALAVLIAPSPALAVSFEGLGFLPGADGTVSEARGVSADGTVVVGTSYAADGKVQAFLWTVADGMAPIPRPTGLAMSWASGVSNNGDYVCGWAANTVTLPDGTEAYRWQKSTGAMDHMSVANAGVWAKGISADGQFVVGTWSIPVNNVDVAFRWTQAGGKVPLLSNPSYRTDAEGISGNGQVVVGDIIEVSTGKRDAYRWDASTGIMTPLGGFTASAVSRDGHVVVGSIDAGPGPTEACRWTEGDGMETLGSLYPESRSFAYGVSGDGSKVVGYFERPDDTTAAFLWDPVHGKRLLKEVLEDDWGLDLTGWQLIRAWALSDDGETVVGRGIDPQGHEQAFRAVMAPEPGTLCLLIAAAVCLFCYARRCR